MPFHPPQAGRPARSPTIVLVPGWEVPYESYGRTTIRYVAVGFLSLATLVMMSGLVFDSPTSLTAWLMAPLFFAAFVTFGWRLALVGVWIGERGIRVTMVVRTRVVRWAEFDRVWLGPATGYDALALWISTRDGANIETPIWRQGTRVMHRNRTKLPPHELSGLMERLRAEARLNS